MGTDKALPPTPGETIKWRVRFCEAWEEQLRKIELSFGDVREPLGTAIALAGEPGQLSATLRVPTSIPQDGLYLWLSVESVENEDVNRYLISWHVAGTR